MPFSQTSQISTILNYIERLFPHTILDVGVGMGQYGFLLRTNLEGSNLFRIENGVGRQSFKEEWQIQIDGIEGCGGYFTPVHEYSYNRLLVGEALELLATLPTGSYELVLAIDILEHFDPERGKLFLAQLQRVASKAALISTPKEFIPQEVPANPYENHRSHWKLTELNGCGYKKLLDNDCSWIVIYETQDIAQLLSSPP